MIASAFALLPLAAVVANAQYTATYTFGNLPSSSEQGQYGYNNCGGGSSQTSNCQNVVVNAVDDFCLWGPPATTSNEGDGTSKIGNVEQIVVSYCLRDGYGTRLIPQGTITAAHFVKVESSKVSYVQVTGMGDLTKLLIPAGDDGGELDPHSWTGLGNPQGGLVFTNAFGGYEQTHEWTSFMSSNQFCIRACRDGPNAAAYCEHIYDVLSCGFTIPGDFSDGFTQCLGDPTDEAPGVYGGSTFHQGDPTTPAPHPAGATSACTTFSTIGGGNANLAVSGSTSASASQSASSASASITSSASSSSMSASSSQSGGSSASSTSSSMSSSGMVTSRMSTTAAPTSTAANAAASASASASTSRSSGERVGAGMAGVMAGVGAVAAGAFLL